MNDGWLYYRGDPADLVGQDFDLEAWRRRIVGPRPDWHQRAACIGVETSVFFPDKGGTVKAALEVCGRCIVRTDCLEWAITEGIEDGVLGGMTATARVAHRRAAQARARHA